jgi:hypothetical protein
MIYSAWTQMRSWFSLKVLKRPVREMPRERCVHNTGCHLCPRSRCKGELNDRDDPDLTKPRASTSGHCLYIHSANGVIRIRISTEAANARRARQAAEERERTPPRLWKAPGYDEETWQRS